MDWWFYLEIWRDCNDNEGDEVIDRAQFTVELSVRMMRAAPSPNGISVSDASGNSWIPKAEARISRVRWLQAR